MLGISRSSASAFTMVFYPRFGFSLCWTGSNFVVCSVSSQRNRTIFLSAHIQSSSNSYIWAELRANMIVAQILNVAFLIIFSILFFSSCRVNSNYILNRHFFERDVSFVLAASWKCCFKVVADSIKLWLLVKNFLACCCFEKQEMVV